MLISTSLWQRTKDCQNLFALNVEFAALGADEFQNKSVESNPRAANRRKDKITFFMMPSLDAVLSFSFRSTSILRKLVR